MDTHPHQWVLVIEGKYYFIEELIGYNWWSLNDIFGCLIGLKNEGSMKVGLHIFIPTLARMQRYRCMGLKDLVTKSISNNIQICLNYSYNSCY